MGRVTRRATFGCGLVLLLALGGCGTFGGREASWTPPPIDAERVPDAVPRAEPLSKSGNPPYYDVFGQRYYVMRSARGYVERGIASWYGPDFHGKRTSSGERYDMYQMTAAHKTLPIPCYVEVTNLQTGRRAVLKVNDRGPFKDNRIIDLSYVAARKLGIWQQGTGLVEVRVIDPAHPIMPATPQPAAQVAEVTASTERNIAPPSAQPPTQVAAAPAATVPSVPPAIVPTQPAVAPLPTPPFFLQVGAFFDRANAERLRERLTQVFQNVRVSPAENNGQAVYRVQIGPFTNVEASDRVVQTLHGIGISDHRVVLD